VLVTFPASNGNEANLKGMRTCFPADHPDRFGRPPCKVDLLGWLIHERVRIPATASGFPLSCVNHPSVAPL